MQEGARVALLGLDVDGGEPVDRIHERGQVELGEVGPAEPAVAVGGPLHGRAHRVAVTQVEVVPHLDLVPVVEDRASGQGEQQVVEELGQPAVPVEERGQPPADAHVPLHPGILGVLGEQVVPLLLGDLLQGQLVVVAQEDGPLGAARGLGGLGQNFGDRVALLPPDGGEQPRHQGEVEAQVALVVVTEVVGHVGRPPVGLGQQDAPGVFDIQLGPDPADEGVGLLQVLAGGAVPLVEVGDGVEPETVEAEVEPEADHVEDGFAHFGVVVVEVGLVRIEAVPVVLVALGVVGPVRPFDVDEDDPRLGPLLVVVVPHVPVRLGVVAALARLDEPGMLIAGVVDDQVGDDPDAPGVGLVQQTAEVVHRPALGMDRVVVADVVAPVTEGGRIEGEQPQAVHPQPLEVIQFGDEPGDVAGTVVVAVEEPPDEHLVEDGPLEPERILPRRRQRLAARGGASANDPSGVGRTAGLSGKRVRVRRSRPNATRGPVPASRPQRSTEPSRGPESMDDNRRSAPV